VKIARTLLDEIVGHALAEAPNECCGVVAVVGGSPAEAVAVHPARNAAASPLRFEIDPGEALALVSGIERVDQELGAIYHSHTRTAPYPSQTDIGFAASWPGVEWIIVGLADGSGAPEVRSYLIEGPVVTEVPLAIEA
jgi:proteasome lid subunit RPN8/RPN11